MQPRIVSRVLALVILGPPIGCAVALELSHLRFPLLHGAQISVDWIVLCFGYVLGLPPAIATAAISCMTAAYLPAIGRIAMTTAAGFFLSWPFGAIWGIGMHVMLHLAFRMAIGGAIAALICVTLVEVRLPRTEAANLQE